MAPTTFYQQGALILHDGRPTGLKGRLNFGAGIITNPSHVITLMDSNFAKTVGTANNRPTDDANDSYIGFDAGDGNPAHTGISFGAPVAISQYIANVGDGSSWKERLTSSLKEFATNVKIDGNLTVVGTCTGCGTGGGGGGISNLNGATVATQSFGAPGTTGTAPSWSTNTGTGVHTLNVPMADQAGVTAGLISNAEYAAMASLTSPALTGNPTAPTQAAGDNSTKIATTAFVLANGEQPSFTGSKTIVGTLHVTSDATIDGALNFQGSYQIDSPAAGTAMVAPLTGHTKFGIDSDGKLKYATGGNGLAEVATVTSNVATATALAGNPVNCAAGQAAAGVDASGNAEGCAAYTPATVVPGTAPGAGQILIGNGTAYVPVAVSGDISLAASGAATIASKQGNGSKVQMASGSFTSGNYRSSDASGNAVDSGVKAGPYTMWQISDRGGNATGYAAPTNGTQAKVFGVFLPYALSTSQITYVVGTADNTANVYDIGIYDSSGNLLVNLGGVAGTSFAPTTGAIVKPWTQGAKTLQPGMYYIAFSSNCTATCAALNSDSSGGAASFFWNAAMTSMATGGVLQAGPMTFTNNYSAGATRPVFWVR
jgi:hypothetical protein